MKPSFRAATAPDDRRFVITTWSSSFKTSYAAGLIQTEDWPTIMHAQIGKVLDRPGATTLVAYERTDPSFLYGFASADVTERGKPIVFYVYVKEPYRRAGIARALFAELGINPSLPFVYACKTPAVTHVHDKIPRAKWNPLVARYPKEQQR